jgi:proline iminopeptidase
VRVTLPDGYAMYVEELGEGLPLLVLHGGPGLDHGMFRPYLDALADEFRVLYVDERGQGRSERVDPQTLTLDVLARDVDLLVDALGLDHFAVLGHSFGAIIATHHAIEYGTADAYVISGGADSSDALMAEVMAKLESLGPDGAAIADSWEREKTVQTDDEVRELLEAQMPFHFHRPPPPGYYLDFAPSPEVLRHFANAGYGDFDYRPNLARVAKPTLVIVGEYDQTTTPRAAGVLHAGISGSELEVIPDAGHMSFVEQPDEYLRTVRAFLRVATA